MNRLKFLPRWLDFLTLKSRIIAIFVSSSLMIFLGISLVSYFAITAILTNKINSGMVSNLEQILLSLQNNISTLNYVSQQLAVQGYVGSKLDEFLNSNVPYERAQLLDDMKTDISIITFANPSIGLTMYYFEDDKSTMLENSVPKENFNPDILPRLASYYGISYYGPHVSMDQFSDQYVLSVLRKVDLPDKDDAFIYVETSFKITQDILETDQTGIMVSHLMLDNDNRITYSEVPLVFPVNSIFQTEGASQGLTARPEDYYWFKATSNQGWSVVSVIAAADYNKEKNQWVIRMLLLLVLFLAINLLLALLVWNIVYRPLDRFDKEIKWIENGNFHTEAALTHIPEIDVLLGQFQKMKGQILELFKEVEIKEKRRADLEIEKLLYQINPHFLMNTLNTAHWMALMNDQTEIDQIIQTLNKLLSYNLGKTGRSTTIADELEALQQYVVLQQIRYEFEYATQISVDEEVLKMSIPRFILQPIVENAIYHGLSERGLITVKVELHDWIEISITDNGTGMTREKIEELLTKVQVDQVKVGMGIGMNYVKRMLESYYSGQAKIAIESLPGKGTTIRLCLPVQPVQAEGQ